MIRIVRTLCVLVGCAVAALGLPRAALAQQGKSDIEVSAQLSSERVYVGERVTLEISVNGSRSAQIAEDLSIDGFETEYLGGFPRSQSFTSIINGRMTQETFEGIVYQYALVPLHSGMLSIPPISLQVQGKTYQTPPLVVRAVQASEDPNVKLILETDEQHPYVGQPITLSLTLGLADGTFGADQIEFVLPAVKGPFQVVPPEGSGGGANQTFTILGQSVPYVEGRTVIDGTGFRTYSAQLHLVPRRNGHFSIGPATVRGRLQTEQARSIFDRPRMRRFVVPSGGLNIEVRQLPTEGKPTNFSGLIGRCAVYTQASPTEVNVGDPVELTVRVSAPLPSAVDPPALNQQTDLTERFRVALEEGKTRLEPGARVFTYTLRAITDDVAQIPALELPYFDVDSGRYEIASSVPIPIRVRPTKVVTAADAEGRRLSPRSASAELHNAAGGIRHNYGLDRALVDQRFTLAAAVQSPVVMTVLLAPPSAYVLTALVLITRKRDSDGARKRQRTALIRATASLDGDVDARAIERALRTYVGNITNRSAETLTSRDIADCLESLDISVPMRDRMTDVLNRCEQSVYATLADDDVQALRNEALDVLREIENQRKKGRR